MSVTFSFKMKVIMTKFMLDNTLKFFHTKLFQIFAVDFNMMRIKQIAAAGCAKAVIEIRFMEKWPVKTFQ